MATAKVKRRLVLGIGTPVWREFVEHRLQDGYGVDDIAIWLGCHVDHVRNHVHALRKSGVLAKWWGR